MTDKTINIFGKEYHIEELYKIAHGESDGVLEFLTQNTEYICDCDAPGVRQSDVYEWQFIRKSKLTGNTIATIYVRYFRDTDTLSLEDELEVKYKKLTKKQFRKKDYKFRHDLGGLCIGYNMDWITKGDGTWPDENEEYEMAFDMFRGRKERLNVGEYFSMEIFGRKYIAYRNEDGVFTI